MMTQTEKEKQMAVELLKAQQGLDKANAALADYNIQLENWRDEYNEVSAVCEEQQRIAVKAQGDFENLKAMLARIKKHVQLKDWPEVERIFAGLAL